MNNSSLWTDASELVLEDSAAAIRWHYEEQTEPHDHDFKIFKYFNDSNQVLLDVGANIGISVASFRKFNQSAKVVSIEPAPWLEPGLAWLKQREGDRFEYSMVGAGAKSEIRDLFIPCLDNVPNFYLASFVSSRFGPSSHAIDEMKFLMGPGASEKRYSVCKVSVSIRAIDELKLSPSLVKIDAETFEYEVLQGMARTLARNRPLILIEGANRDAMIASFFRIRDYQFAERQEDQLVCTDNVGRSENGFFLPKERIGEYQQRGVILA